MIIIEFKKLLNWAQPLDDEPVDFLSLISELKSKR